MRGLSAKQQLFVQEYLIDLNATQAATRAGYSSKNADKIGPELLGKTRVAQTIQKAMEERVSRTKITADRVLEEYAKIGFANITDFVEFRTEKKILRVDANGDPVFGYVQVLELKNSTDVQGSAISEVSMSREGQIRLKLHDKKGALDSIARHIGMFNDKLTVDNEGEREIKITFVDPHSN
jgi:phage terminase small subunit